MLIKELTLKQELTTELLRSLMSYDCDTGKFHWIVNVSNVKAGSIVVTLSNDDGYIRTSIFGKRYLLHRLAWLYTHGKWPTKQIDHINGNRSDNRLENLREASNAQNCQNIIARRTNPSGFLGVSRHENKWRAAISVNGKRKNLGRFDTPEAAFDAYSKAKAELHTFSPVAR